MKIINHVRMCYTWCILHVYVHNTYIVVDMGVKRYLNLCCYVRYNTEYFNPGKV